LPGFVLSDAGRKQAAMAAERLAGVAAAPLRIRSSPLERARETADIISATLQQQGNVAPVSVDERLIEAGSWKEGLPRRFAPRAVLRRLLEPQARARQEALPAVARRLREAVMDAIQRPDAVEPALVSHQVPIWLARLVFEHGFPGPETPLRVRVWPWLSFREACSYGSITTLDLVDGELVGARYWAPT